MPVVLLPPLQILQYKQRVPRAVICSEWVKFEATSLLMPLSWY